MAIRLVWGFVGSPHARFADFIPSPRGFVAYVRDAAAGRERRDLGHNPAGGAMVAALLATVLGLAATSVSAAPANPPAGSTGANVIVVLGKDTPPAT